MELYFQGRQGEFKMKMITPEEVQKRLENGEDLHLIDVREDDEVAQGMIPQATHIRMSEIPEHLDELDKDKEYIIVCRSGGRSGKVTDFLTEKGYERATNMTGGMLAWEGEQKPKV